MDAETNFDKFIHLSNMLTKVTLGLVDYVFETRIVPVKLLLFREQFITYVKENEEQLLEYGLKYILKNKKEILNFSLNNLSESDLNSESDNSSRKHIDNNLNKLRKDVKTFNVSNYTNEQIIDIMLKICLNAKKTLSKQSINCIFDYVKLLIKILEKIKNIF